MKERPFVPLCWKQHKCLCRAGEWGLLCMKVDQVFFPTAAVQIDVKSSPPVHYQLSQSCWPPRVTLAQLASSHSTDGFNGIVSPYFKGCLEISWKRKVSDINTPEQEKKDDIEGIFFSSGEYLSSS